MFRFGAPEWLPALLVVPLLFLGYWLAARGRRRALDRFGEGALVAKLTASVSMTARRVRAGLVVLAVGLVVVALARPQFGTRVETVQSIGQDVVVAVDLSMSMLAEDVVPNRLERARLAILRLMDRLDGDRIGLVAFAGDAFVQSPLTVDYSAAALFLGAMNPDIMPVPGTDLGAALRVSLDALEAGERDTRALVLVTDAEDHEGDFETELARAREGGVEVYLVVFGSAEGVPIPQNDDQGRRQGFLRDEEGNVVTTRLDEETIAALEDLGDARVVRAGVDGRAFDELVDEIAAGEGEAVDALQFTQFEEQYQIFLALALVLLLAEAVIPDRKRTREAWLGRFE
jgi:Ca-activated chloride channel family protein